MQVIIKRVVSLLMSLVMLILAAFGIGTSGVTDGMKTGDWLKALCEEFGMTTYSSEDPYYEGITAESEYFGAVQAAYEWGIIDEKDDMDLDAPLTNEFAAKCLVKAARLEAENVPEIKNAKWLDYAEEVAIACANGLFKLSALGFFKVEILSVEDALKVLADAKTMWANQSFDETFANYTVKDGVKDLTAASYTEADGKFVYDDADLAKGDVFVNEQGAYKVKAVAKEDGKTVVSAAEVALEDAVDAVSMEGTVEANLEDAQVVNEFNGEVIQDYAEEESFAAQSKVGDWVKEQATGLVNMAVDKAKKEINKLLANPKISFSVKGYKIKAAYTDGTVALSVSGNPTSHIAIAKSYALSNINFSTKYDANLAKLKINEAYVIANYDLVDQTAVTGSYAASVVPTETENEVDFLTRVKEGLFKISEGNAVKIDVVTFSVPVGKTGLIVSLKLSVSISVSGKVEVIVTANETKGVEVIDNHVRYISDSTIYERQYNISGDFQVTVGLYLSLNFLSYDIVDAYIVGGIGAVVTTNVYRNNEIVVEGLQIPADVYLEATAGNDAFDDTQSCIDIEFYGILRIAVGENSLCKKIGLHKTWSIFDRSNGAFAHWHLEDGQRVDACTRAA